MADNEGYEIRVPRRTQWLPTAAAGFMRSLVEVAGTARFLLDIDVTADGASFGVRVEPPSPITHQSLQALVASFYAGGEVLRHDRPPVDLPHHRRTVLIGRASQSWLSTPVSISAFKSADPLITVVQTMGGLLPQERAAIRLNVQSIKPSDEEILDYTTQSAWDAGQRPPYFAGAQGWTALLALIGSVGHERQLRKERVLIYSPAVTEQIVSRLRQPFVIVAVSLSFWTPKKERLEQLSAVLGAYAGVQTGDVRLTMAGAKDYVIRSEGEVEGSTPLVLYTMLRDKQPKKMQSDWASGLNFYLTADELAAFWHLPHEGFGQIKVLWSASVPAHLRSDDGDNAILIGTADGNTAVPVSLSRRDRVYHAYITGKTGMGKSTLMHRLIHQDIEAGEGVAVIDPHGELIKDILRGGIPAARVNDVLYLRCADAEFPVPLNPFRLTPGVEHGVLFETALWIWKSIYANSWSESRMETVFRNLLQLVLIDPHATPLDIQEVCTNGHYRKRLLDIARKRDMLSMVAEGFWRSFEAMSPSEQRAYTQSILNRLAAFLGSAHIELMACHPNTLDFRKLIKGKRIVLIDLSGDRISTEVGSLGAIFLAQFFLASQSLGAIKQATPRYYLYVDETQRLITTAIKDMFSEARKYGLSLTLANQYIGQLDPETRAGIENNAGTKISFECSTNEASLTGRLYKPEVTEDDLVGLGRGRAAIKTRYGGETLSSFIVNTYPALEPAPDAAVAVAQIGARTNLGLGLVPAREIKQWLKKRYQSDLFTKPPQATDLTDFE